MDEQDTHDQGNRETKEGFRLVHLVVIVVIIGALAAIVISNFLNFRNKAKNSEAKSNLGAIRASQVAFFAEWGFWVGNQPFTPVSDRRGNPDRVPWITTTRFSILGFAPEGNVYFSYSLEGTNYPREAEGFTANAVGDMDGDGTTRTFIITPFSIKRIRPPIAF